MRMSVNPQEIITKIEFGTSPLKRRIAALNSMCEADTRSVSLSPVILVEN